MPTMTDALMGLRLLVALVATKAAQKGLLKVMIAGHTFHVHPLTGRLMPAVAGGDGTDEDDGDKDDESDDGDKDGDDDQDEDDAGDAEDGSDDSDDDDEEEGLPDNIKSILKKNRDEVKELRKKNRQLARDAAKSKAKASDSDDEDDDSGEPDKGTQKLRTANVLTALAEEKITGKRAKALAKLLDDVEFDEDDEPTNLKDAIDAAKETYGDTIVRPKKKPGKTDAGNGKDDGERPSLTAEELQFAKEFGMSPKEYADHKSTQPPPPSKKKD